MDEANFPSPPPPPPAVPPLPPPPGPFTAPPPRIVPTPTAPPKKSGRGWMVLALVLFLLLLISVFANFGQLVTSVTNLSPPSRYAAGPRMEEVVLKESRSENKVAVIPVEGVITSQQIDGTAFNQVDVIKAQLQRAKKDDDVSAVVLRVDSPGGEVLASDEIATALRDFQDDSGKPVVVSMGNLAASGGYYVSAPCRWIVANEMTITGSIGVIMSGLNYRGLMDKVGLQPKVYKSGKFKDMLSGSRKPEDVTPEEEKMVQSLIDEVYGKFRKVVAEGRAAANDENGSDGRPLIPGWTNYVDGRVMSGTQAYELGFVDELGDFDTAVRRANELCGNTSAKVVEYRQIVDLADIFRMFGKSEPAQVKVDLGIPAPKLKAGIPYFLHADYIY
jgi:protease-4